jgi:hypothetical protein
MAEVALKEGDVITHKGTKLECTFITYQEIDGKKMNFTYSFRPLTDMNRERKETTIPEVEEAKEA